MTEKNEGGRITLKVEASVGNSLKITWGDTHTCSDFLPYSIDRDRLIRCSDNVRRCLKELVVTHISEHGVNESAQKLKDLAKAGSKLYDILFLGDNNERSEIIKSWLKDKYLESKPRIIVTVGDRIYVPWGLIFDSDPEILSDKINIELFENFWCLKYLLSSKYYRINPIIIKTKTNSIEVIPVINRKAFETATRDFAKEEGDIINQLSSRWNGPAYSKRDFLDRWEQSVGSDILIYFYCHANGTNLALSDNEMFTIDDFSLELRRKPTIEQRTNSAIVFLNGCSTAIGDSGGGFLEATASSDFCGFIGTETEVPNIFALRFGSAFLREWLNGAGSILHVMNIMRRKHWPLGLLYSIYCFPEFQVEKTNRFASLSEVSAGNFSESKIGNRDWE